MNRKQKPYRFVEDYCLHYRFGVASENKLLEDRLYHSNLEKVFPNLFSKTPLEDHLAESSSESSESDSDDSDLPEVHQCRVYRCKDPECFSCDLANDCYNCSHCGVNKSLFVPCLDCKGPDFHPVSLHKEIRCSYHKEFPKALTPQFTVFHESSKVAQAKFIPVYSDSAQDMSDPKKSLINDRDKLAEYVASKEKREQEMKQRSHKKTKSQEDEVTLQQEPKDLLDTVLQGTYSQCQIGSRLEPQIDLNVDTSRFHLTPAALPKEMRMPLISKPPVIEAATPQNQRDGVLTNATQGVVNEPVGKTLIDSAAVDGTKNELSGPEHARKPCNCYRTDAKPCEYPNEHMAFREPCVLCAIEHAPPCNCYKHRSLLDNHKRNVNEAINVVIANHSRACYDSQCPLRGKDMTDDPASKWFDTMIKLERVMFRCPLNVTDFSLQGSIDCGTNETCSQLTPDMKSVQNRACLDTYINNFLPRPLVPGQKRGNGITKMKFWDRLSSYQEQFTDYTLSTHSPLISNINRPILNDDDEEIGGRYDEVYEFWDRNKIFTPKKILVKKPETLVKLVETDDMPLKFETLHALNRSARMNKVLQESCGQTKVILRLLEVLDNCDHDGIRRLAIYVLSMALRFPSGRCVFFELGPTTVKNLYHHYLTDKRYAMRRAYMLVLSNLLEDTGACAMLCNAVSFENTFANMCEKDPDLQTYLMKTVFYAMHDMEGREKLVALPEFRLTPILAGCLSKRSRVREIALNLLDAIVSFCKQDVVIQTFKDVRGIKVLEKILKKAYMAYAHPVVLKIYEKLAEDPEAGPAIKEGSLANLVEFVNTVDDPKLIAHTLRVLVKMARDPLTKEVLALTNVITKVAPLLVHTNEELAQSVLMIIELMAAKGSRNLITQQLVKADPMVDLLWVVGSENRGWDTKVIALRCIIALLNLSPFFGECYIRCKNATNVTNLLCHQAKFLTTYSKTLLVQVLSVLAKSKRNYEFLIRNKTIKALLYSFKCFDSFESQLYAHSVGLLAFMMKDRRAVIQFSNVKNSWNLLASKFMERKFISADILMNLMFLVTDLTDNFELGAKAFMNNGFLRWMIDLEEIYPEMSGSIRNAVDSIIRNYLPLKFAHHGFLSYQDFTNRSLFFATKDTYNVYKDKYPFPMFDKGISNKLKPEKPIYYFNLPIGMRGTSSEDLGKLLQIETSDNFDLYTTVSKSADSVHKSPEKSEDEETFFPLETDSKLEDIFGQIKSALVLIDVQSPPENHRRRRLNEIMGIARTVVKSMIGYDPTVRVTRRIQEIYLETLKKQLGSNIFPIGRLVMGYKLERALLFKLFADVLGIPCWLYRMGHKSAWNEVYVPSDEGYQGGELVANYIVDLMSLDPQLLPIKSPAAKAYLSNVDDY